MAPLVSMPFFWRNSDLNPSYQRYFLWIRLSLFVLLQIFSGGLLKWLGPPLPICPDKRGLSPGHWRPSSLLPACNSL